LIADLGLRIADFVFAETRGDLESHQKHNPQSQIRNPQSEVA